MTHQTNIAIAQQRPIFISMDFGQFFGYLAMIVTVFVWAAFALTTRSSSASALAFSDVALIRSLVPALFFMAFIPSRISQIRKAGLKHCAAISMGAGLPFFWLACIGGAVTSAAHVSALIAGTVPVFVAVLSWMIYGKSITKSAGIGLAMILAGALLLIIASGLDVPILGVSALLLAAFLWASFTIAIKTSGLDPIACAIVISVPSAILVGFLMGMGVVETNLGSFTISQALPYILIQGIAVSVIAIVTYAFAIARLGSTQCSSLGSIAPVLTAILAIPFLGENLNLLTLLAILAVCLGVLMSVNSKRV